MDPDQAAFAVGPESLVSIQKQQPKTPQSASTAPTEQNSLDRVRSLYGDAFDEEKILKPSKEPGNLWDEQDAKNGSQGAEQQRQADLKRRQRQAELRRQRQQDDPAAWPDRFEGTQGPAGVDERMNPVAAVRRWQEALFGPDTDD